MKKRRYTPAPVLVLCMVFSATGYGKETGKSVDLFSAEYVKSSTSDRSISDNGLHFLVDQPSLSLSNVDFKLIEDKHGVEIKLTAEQRHNLNRTIAQYQDQRLAIVYDGHLVMSAIFKEPLTGKGLFLSFSSNKEFRTFKKLLIDKGI